MDRLMDLCLVLIVSLAWGALLFIFFESPAENEKGDK